MYDHQEAARPGRRTDLPVAEGELDADLVRSVKRASYMRQGFYFVVLAVALAGQVTGAVEALHIPLVAAIPAVGALELGGIVVLANADVRRRLGERAVASRLLSAAIAAWAVAFNWLAHSNHLLGGFYAGMSALGYAVWLMHTENQRRDRLRAKGDLPPTTPAYEMWGHWVRHPFLTMRAKALAKAHPQLGLYDSIAAAREEVHRERRTSAISKVLHRKIRSAVDPTTADIAVHVYNLDKIAERLADNADYDGLTALIGRDLAPERIAGEPLALTDKPDEELPPLQAISLDPTPALTAAPEPALEPEPELIRESNREPEPIRPNSPKLLSKDLYDTLNNLMPIRPDTPPPPVTRTVIDAGPVQEPLPEPEPEPIPASASTPRTRPSLRKRVHAALDEHVPAGDTRDNAELLQFVGEVLDLSDLELTSAGQYVRSWKMGSGRPIEYYVPSQK
jgi:hypothetical protein